jgi:hypothetical protein
MTLVGGESAAITSTWTVTAGNTIVMFTVQGGDQGNFNPTSTKGDSFVQVAQTGSIHNDAVSVNMFYIVNAVGGPTQLRFNDPDWNGGQTGIACEYSGANNTSPIDVYSSSATTFEAGTSATTGSTNTTTTNDLMFSVWYNGGNFSEITSYSGTQRYQSSDYINFVQDATVASPGSYTSTVAFDGGSWHWIGMQAAIKP